MIVLGRNPHVFLKIQPFAYRLALSFSIVLLSLMTVYFQEILLGIEYIEQGPQMQRHVSVLRGTAPNPWQYRILAEYLAEFSIRLCAYLRLPHPALLGFLGMRIAQNIGIFGLAYVYYRKLGCSRLHAFIGINILAWGMNHAYHDSDLQFNTYFDLLFYLAAGVLICSQRLAGIIPLTFLAALNRETSGLIPLLPLALLFPQTQARKLSNQTILTTTISSGAIYAMVFLGLRAYFGARPLFIAHDAPPGAQLLLYNLSNPHTWPYLLATLGFIPILSLRSFQRWPGIVKGFFWLIAPCWFLIHAISSVMAETRLFLVPQALLFIPGVLYWDASGARSERSMQTEEQYVRNLRENLC